MRSGDLGGPGDHLEHLRPELGQLALADAGLFDRLRAWRATVAKEQKLPAYVIFHDATLRAIAARRPTTLDELGTISGVGQNKLGKFGEQVLAQLE